MARRTKKENRIPIGVPPVELEHLPRAPLKLAIAQVRFAPVFAVEQAAVVADFQAGLGERYLAQAPVRPMDQGQAGAESVWLFRDHEKDWTVSLSATSLALEAITYVDFDDFAGELAAILQTLEGVFEPRQEVRLGVRYVNRIEDDRLQKRGVGFFVNEQLTSPVGGDLGGDLQSSLCELRFRERGGHVTIRHGLVEPSTYLIDFDHFSEGERDFAPKTIVRRVQRFHALIERLFVWSISERYLKELRGAGK
ncbi:MAG: TIGR04255 family protein [Solirubrobacterales bacterium]|nr:TIGR04255 family protein [Solirubrobacterales bacterium]